MTLKPRRIDWTLSATPTRRGVRVFLVAALLTIAPPVSCFLAIWLAIVISRGPSTPERSFTALDFFPPISVYPPDYEIVEGPRWAGPSDCLGEEDDACAYYKPESEAFGRVQIFVFHQSHWNNALEKYQYELLFLTDYGPVSQITFQSDRAQESTLRCQPTTPDNWLWCAYVARYEEFVIDLRAGVGPDHLSFAEFERLLQAIDQRAIELLGPLPAD
jgi:hypothetical protein